MTPPSDPERPDFAAYLAGELPADEADAVEERIAADPDARAHVEALERTFALLDHLPPPPRTTPDLAAKTLVQIADSHTAVTRYDNARLAVAPSATRVLTGLAVAALVVLAGLGVGEAARTLARPARPPGDLAADYLVSVRLPWYYGCEDLGFVRELDARNLFPREPTSVARFGTGSESSADELIATFQTLPEVCQDQLRALDAGLTALPPGERGPLLETLDGYSAWLETLPVEDRRRLFETPRAKRVAAIAGMVGRSPARDGRWAEATWWPQLVTPGRVWPFTEPALAGEVERYVSDVLKVDFAARGDPAATGRLTREEFLDLRSHREAATKDHLWPLYGLHLARLARRHPYLPPPPADKEIVDRAGLPVEFLRAARQRKLLFRSDRPYPRGLWPEFALEVAAEAKKAGVRVPEAFGPCRPGELSPAVRKLLGEFTPEESARLQAVEGRWPDYPQLLVDTATRHDLPVPGVTLPGAPSKWRSTYGLAPARQTP